MEITAGDAAYWSALTGTQWLTDDGVVATVAIDQCEYCGHSAPCPHMAEHLGVDDEFIEYVNRTPLPLAVIARDRDIPLADLKIALGL